MNIAFPPLDPTAPDMVTRWDLAFDADLRPRSAFEDTKYPWTVEFFVNHAACQTVGFHLVASNRTNLDWHELCRQAERAGLVITTITLAPMWDANERSVRIACGKLRRALAAKTPRPAS